MNLFIKCALTNPNVKGTANEGHVSNKKHKMSRGKIMNLRQIYEVVKNVLDLYGDWRCKDRFYRFQEIVPFKSFRKCKTCNKEDFILKSNSNKIMLCGSGDNIILF